MLAFLRLLTAHFIGVLSAMVIATPGDLQLDVLQCRNREGIIPAPPCMPLHAIIQSFASNHGRNVIL